MVTLHYSIQLCLIQISIKYLYFYVEATVNTN